VTNVLSGSTVKLQHQFTTDVSVTPTGATLSVRLPDGTTQPLTPATPAAGPNPTATQLVSFPVPGPYSLYWGLATNDGQTIVEQDDYFAPNTAVHRFVRERLNANDPARAVLPDAPLDSALCFVSRLVLRRLSDVLPSYQAVPAADVNTFDQALALVAAAYLRPLTPKTVASGELTTIQIGTDKWQFAELAARAEKPLDPVEQQWLDQAGELFMSCSFVAVDDAALTQFPLFQINGSRRYARQQIGQMGHPGVGSEATTPWYQLWGDIQAQWAWERGAQLTWG